MSLAGLENYIASNKKTIEKVFNFKPSLTASQWAAKIRRMDGGRRYHFNFAPYQREMIETPFKKDVQMTVFQMASRLGKTETVMNLIGHSIDEQPRRILVLYPTTSQAEKWSKETLEKELFESTPNLQWLVRGGRRNSNNTILHKLFPGGLINIFGGNAPGEMRRAKGNLLFADEVDSLQTSNTDEGDQLEIFWMRGSEYADAVRIAASYPSVEGQSRIAALMEKSDFRKWFTPCPKCSEYIVMERGHVKHPKDKPEKAVVECPECAKTFNDKQRRESVKQGEWRATRKFNGVAGFWANGMISPHPKQKGFKSHLHWIADQTLKIDTADNPERAKHVFTNTFDALPYKPEVIEAPSAHILLERREDYKPYHKLPEEVLILTAGVDIQKRWIEAAVWGWGEGKQSWLLEHKKISGAPDDPGTWNALESFLASCRYKHPLGVELALFEPGSRVFVDSGHWSNHVLPWTFSKQSMGVYACHGLPSINAPILGKPRIAANPKARGYPLGVNQAKDIIYSRLALDWPEGGDQFPAGFVHFNDVATVDFMEGLTCEYGKHEIYRGEIFTRYICPSGKRNEPLDTYVYALAAAIDINPNFERIRENMSKKGGKPVNKEKKAAPPRPIQKRRRVRKNFIGGFKT